jgi:hypothetical protein
MAGFQAYTADGKLQFDADLISYGFTGKGNATAVRTVISNYPYMIATVNVTSAIYPLIFLRGDRPFHLLSVSKSSSSWEFRYSVPPDGAASFVFDYYVFDKMGIGGSYGLELYNASGQLTFTANQSPLHLIYVGMAPGTNWTHSGSTTTISVPAMTGRTCAVMLSGARVHSEEISGNGIGGYLESIKPLSNGVEVSWFEEWFVFADSVVGNASYPQGGQSMILVADVTGL